ncbi:MAG: hypothetical protein ACXWPM_02945 [Bdellovibrionota bacterium]
MNQTGKTLNRLFVLVGVLALAGCSHPGRLQEMQDVSYRIRISPLAEKSEIDALKASIEKRTGGRASFTKYDELNGDLLLSFPEGIGLGKRIAVEEVFGLYGIICGSCESGTACGSQFSAEPGCGGYFSFN